jgi:hypothetical protein
MRTALLLLSVACVVPFAAACVVNNAPPPASGSNTPAPAQPAFQDTPPPTDPPKPINYSVADGRPRGLQPGHPEAYWVWHDERGRHWHVRTTTTNHLHRFHGWVFPDGQFTELRPTRMEWNDRIRGNANGIVFDFHTDGNEDGFDFKVSGNQCVRFYLNIDGRHEPGLVNIGATDAHPPHWHFKVCP